MDADMLVLGDVAELLDIKLEKPWVCCRAGLTDVSVIDCAAFRGAAKWWPTIGLMMGSGWKVYHYCQLLAKRGCFSETLPYDWNCRDSNDEWKDSTRLLHFTTVPWQPYRPYPTVSYQPHPKPAWAKRWFDELAEADATAR